MIREARAQFRERGLYEISFPMVPFLVSGFVHAYGGWLWDDVTKTLGVNSSGTKAAMRWILETFKPYMSKTPHGAHRWCNSQKKRLLLL